MTGAWNDSGVACYTPRGACLWQYPEDAAARHRLANRLFTAQLSGNGRYVLGLSYGNVRESDPTLYLWRSDGGGEPAVEIGIGRRCRFTRARRSAKMEVMWLSLTCGRSWRGDQSLSEHRLRLLDHDGTMLWERGGLLFAPTLVALAPDGRTIIVSDGQRTLYALNQQGRILPKRYTLPGSVRQTTLSADGWTLLVYTGDGTVNLFRLG